MRDFIDRLKRIENDMLDFKKIGSRVSINPTVNEITSSSTFDLDETTTSNDPFYYGRYGSVIITFRSNNGTPMNCVFEVDVQVDGVPYYESNKTSSHYMIYYGGEVQMSHSENARNERSIKFFWGVNPGTRLTLKAKAVTSNTGNISVTNTVEN